MQKQRSIMEWLYQKNPQNQKQPHKPPSQQRNKTHQQTPSYNSNKLLMKISGALKKKVVFAAVLRETILLICSEQ